LITFENTKFAGRFDEYLEKIWDILARYLEKKYTITISPETWDEVLGGRRSSGVSEESEKELSRILKTLEANRFGSSQADNQELDDLLNGFTIYRVYKKYKLILRNRIEPGEPGVMEWWSDGTPVLQYSIIPTLHSVIREIIQVINTQH